MDKILDAHDKARDEGFANAQERLKLFHRVNKQAAKWNGTICGGPPVLARVEKGRWLADCECGGAEWVAEGVLFFCRDCGNLKTEGKARPVVFPADRENIEIELLRRAVVLPAAGKHETARILNSQPVVPLLDRNWNVGESVNDLIFQRENAEALANGL